MREIRQSGSEGGEAGNLTGLPYPYQCLSAGVESLAVVEALIDRAGDLDFVQQVRPRRSFCRMWLCRWL